MPKFDNWIMNFFPTLPNYEFLFLSFLSNGHSHKNGHNGAHHGSSITIEHPTPPPPAASSHHFSSLSVPPMRRRRSECNTPINVSKCLESFPYVCVVSYKIENLRWSSRWNVEMHICAEPLFGGRGITALHCCVRLVVYMDTANC